MHFLYKCNSLKVVRKDFTDLVHYVDGNADMLEKTWELMGPDHIKHFANYVQYLFNARQDMIYTPNK